ncbi:MAG: heme transporter CcmC [Candidatus Nitrosocosmicus sp.]
MAFSYRNTLIVLILSSMAIIGIQSLLQIVYAQQDTGISVIRRVEIWGLFYRLMIAAFMVGAAVHGIWIYVTWRFRESNKRYKTYDTTTAASDTKTGGGR